MTAAHNQFTSKLNELEVEYHRMMDRIQVCHEGTREELLQVQKDILEECRRQEMRLKEMTASGRSKAVTELSALHLRYFDEVRTVLEESIPRCLHAGNKTDNASQAEAMALFAEFAIDNAIQAIRCALFSVVSAVNMQNKTDETGER